MFEKYIHLVLLDNIEVEGLLEGLVFVFPKLDGMNHQVWIDNGVIHSGSRRMELNESFDRDGFFKFASGDKAINSFLQAFPQYKLFGEWLIHQTTPYQEDAYRKFYVFDVFDTNSETFLSYVQYKNLLEAYQINFVPCLLSKSNPSLQDLTDCLTYSWLNTSSPEGIVIKNYNYRNCFGRLCFAKLLNEKPAEKVKIVVDYIGKFVEKFVTTHFLDKEYAKLKLTIPENDKTFRPRLIDTIWTTVIMEELGNFVLKNRGISINFGELRVAVINCIKEHFTDLF